MTVLSYITSHEKVEKEKLDLLLLLSYSAQLLVRLQIEQQLHIQNTLRKAVTDEYVQPFISFLSTLIPQLVSKLNCNRISLLVKQYFELYTVNSLEQARFRESKTYDYQAIDQFKQFHFGLFHLTLGACEAEDQQLMKVF